MKSITSHKTNKIHLKKGDRVVVISGSNKGTEGEVQEIFPNKYRAIVEGVNVAKKHKKPTADQPGGINDVELPIHISNLQLIDPKSGKGTRIGRKLNGDKSVRYSKKSGEII